MEEGEDGTSFGYVPGCTLLGREKIIAFLRAAHDAPSLSRCLAVTLALEGIESGESIEELFGPGSTSCYSLSVAPLPSGEYRVRFSCVVSPDSGDGGEWMVSFAGDAVRAIEILDQWII